MCQWNAHCHVLLYTYLILTEIVEQNLHWPMCVEVFAAFLSETSSGKVWPPISRDPALEVFDLANGIRGIIRWCYEDWRY